MGRIMAFDELELIEWVRTRVRAHSALRLGVGDDMAEVVGREKSYLLASDMLLDGVHFDSGKHSMQAIGRKAVARALSDCAAMAVRPVALLFSVALPRSLPADQVRELFHGMIALAEQFDVAVAGGDTARWSGPLAMDVAVSAEPYPGIDPVRRVGAKAGDRVFVSGALGGSILRRHMTFTPRVREAHTIASALGRNLHAMIDVSDGLSLDLWRLCQASGVGASLDESRLKAVTSADAVEHSKCTGKTTLEHVLSDGEDHELLMAVDASAQVDGLELYPIGVVIESGLCLAAVDGSTKEIKPQGYVH